jgi:hypothetical protein
MNANQKAYSAPTLIPAGNVVGQTLGDIRGRQLESDQTGMWPFYPVAVV